MLGFGALASFPLGATPQRATITFAAQAGAYSVTGRSAALSAARQMPLAARAILVTGNPASLQSDRKLIIQTGVYTQAGNPAALRADRQMPLSASAYTLTERAATFQRAVSLSASRGTITQSGYSALPRAGRILPVTNGIFGLTGYASQVSKTRFFNAGSQPILVTPGVTGLIRGYNLTSATSQFVWSLLQPHIFESSFFFDDSEVIIVPWENTSIIIAGKSLEDLSGEIICVPWENSSAIVPAESRSITVEAVIPVEELLEDRTLDAQARLRVGN